MARPSPPRRTPAAEAFTGLLLEVFRLNGRLLAAGDRLAAPLGLSSARWQVLGAIEAAPLPVADIARNMGLARQSVQRLADILAADGIVAYADNPRHKRAKLVQLTARGRTLMNQIDPIQAAWANQATSGLAAPELRAARQILRALRQRIETRGKHTGDRP
jgi:DNA-binding MarR family transcriptional regulator